MPSGSLIALPAFPAAMQSFDAGIISISEANTNPFNGQQQIFYWGAQYLEYHVNMPPMSQANFQAWIVFLKALLGQSNYFQFSSDLTTSFPNDFPAGVYWRLKQNTVNYSFNANHVYSLSWDIRQAI